LGLGIALGLWLALVFGSRNWVPCVTHDVITNEWNETQTQTRTQAQDNFPIQFYEAQAKAMVS